MTGGLQPCLQSRLPQDAPTLSRIGRFAPSPTGPLHFGSLLAALASFLDSRASGSRWLLRIEDLDPPREPPGAAEQIIHTLDAYGLHWDGEIAWQSRRLPLYREILQQLLAAGLAYRCQCSRSELKRRQALLRYDRHCLQHPPSAAATCAIRARYPDQTLSFTDRIQGVRRYPSAQSGGDFILFRRDGLFAYQLAVVVDDAEQGVTDIVRGADLIDETPRQQVLQHYLHYPQPDYAHIPVVTNSSGQKLSKQTFAPALSLEPELIVPTLWKALHFLGQTPPPELRAARRDELLQWAITHWDITAIARQTARCQEGE